MGLKERREKEKAARRNQILDAARALLFEKGLHATSINQIAKQAELGVGTIYFYYRSKEEIFADLQEEGLEILFARILKTSSQNLPPDEKLSTIGRQYIRFSEENRDYYDIINYFLASPEIFFAPNLKSKVDRHGSQIIGLIIETIDTGIRSGLFHSNNPRRDAITFWGTLHGLIQFRKLKDTVLAGDSHEKLLNHAVDHFINGLRRQ
ncbi:MAG: TetR/AcrR family transcriptional regulator [Desulfobacterales bacterium]|nr:TetR/AcrR family transcriptional regulator [Desulfobacterales bacterium]